MKTFSAQRRKAFRPFRRSPQPDPARNRPGPSGPPWLRPAPDLHRRGCDIPTEVDKFLWADVVIYQMPGWWMGAPWTVKRYIDEVFTAGHGSLYANDGRTCPTARMAAAVWCRASAMISATWNAPRQAFDDPSDFEGKGGCGVFPLPQGQPVPSACPASPTFLAVDVMKRPDPGYRRCLPGAPDRGVRAPAEFDGGPVSLRWMEWRVEIQASDEA